MSYVSKAQKDWIRMLYGEKEDHETYQTILEEFGRLVEKEVLPAEQKTDALRARNFLKEFRERFSEREPDLRKAVEQLLTQSGNNSGLTEKVVRSIRELMAQVGAEITRETHIPDNVYRELAEGGLPGISFSEDLGGMGAPYPLFVALLETLGKASPSVGVRYAISNTCAEGLRFNHEAGNLSTYGENILRSLVAGERLAAFGLTEGSVSGSNIMREMQTRAETASDGKSYRINGSKMYITNAETADVYFIFARTSDEPPGDISLFLVERDAPGFRIGQVFEKRVVENSSLGELVLDDVEVPQDHVVGTIGCGAEYAVRMLNSGRITIAALSVGLAQRAFEEYLDTAVAGKKTGGRHLVEYDRTKSRIAEMSMEINAARDMTYRGAWLKEIYDAHPDSKEALREYVIQGNGAKLKASLVAQKVCDYFVKIGGASSVVKETPNLKLYLDSFLYYFGEAVPEVLENVVSHMEVKKFVALKGL